MTGYTDSLVRKNLTFPQFAMECARAFGACIMMRDDPSDTPIPEEFPVDDYYLQRRCEYEAKLERLRAMKPAEIGQWAAAIIKKEIDEAGKSIARTKGTLAKMRATLTEVEAWTPPTSEHQSLKDFMLQQLRDSITFEDVSDWHDGRLQELRKADPMQMWREEIAQTEESIASSAAKHEQEKQRVAVRNQWIRQLRESLEPVRTRKERGG